MVSALLWILVLQAAALLAQGVLAGLSLTAAGGPLLNAHMAVGTVSLLLAAVQVGTALLLWRQGREPSWLAAANVLFLAADSVQAVAGSARLLALHLPLGVALFGAAVALLMWSREQARNEVRLRQGARGTVAG